METNPPLDRPRRPGTALRAKIAPICPSILLWQAHAPFLEAGGTLPEAAQFAAVENFFGSLELPTVPTAAHRRELRLLAEQVGWDVMVWASDTQRNEGLNPGALDADKRKKSQLRFVELMDMAAECGARRFGFCSPPDAHPENREEAVNFFRDELVTLAAAGRARGVSLAIEALDRTAHKRGLLGYAPETAELASAVRKAEPSFGLIWDSAHAALNGEELAASFRLAAPHVVGVHFSDAMLDRAHPKFGDWHMPVGTGDAMKPQVVRPLVLAIAEHARLAKAKLPLAIEEVNRTAGESGTNFSQRAWSYLESTL